MDFAHSIHRWHHAPNPLPAPPLCPGAVSKGMQVTHQRPATLLPDIALLACSVPSCLRCQIPARGICKQRSRKLQTLPQVAHHEMNVPRRRTDVVGNLPPALSCTENGEQWQSPSSVCT